jgi:hypothetical protein
MSTEPEREFVGNGRYAFDQLLGKGGVIEKQEWLRFSDWCFSTFMDANKDGKAVSGEWK